MLKIAVFLFSAYLFTFGTEHLNNARALLVAVCLVGAFFLAYIEDNINHSFKQFIVDFMKVILNYLNKKV